MDNQILHTDASDSNERGIRTTAYLDTMQNRGDTASAPSRPVSPAPEATSQPPPTPLPRQPTRPLVPSMIARPTAEVVRPQPNTALSRFSPRTKIIATTTIVFLLVIGIIAVVLTVFANRSKPQPAGSVQDFQAQRISLGDLSELSPSFDKTLNVNGQLQVNGALIMTPSVEPAQPVTGQLYYDQTSNHLAYYNGTAFVDLLAEGDATGAGAAGGSTNVTNLTNVFNTAAGQEGNFARLDATQTFSGANIFQGDLQVQGPGGANVLAVTAATSSIAVGSASGSSTTSVNAGTGGLAVSTGDAPGVSGSISIKTGNSTTSASGDIEIDAGAGIIDGEIVSDKDFEDGLDNLDPWFGTTLSQTTEQARTGTHSLKETGTSPFAGIIEDVNDPLTPVTPGHQYFFSFWVRAATVPRTINITVQWHGASLTVPMTPTVDNTTGWTQISGTAQAPAGSTATSITITHSGAVGEVHYFDDFTITDLSSGAAISAVNIGATNAKVITIGNLNQVGATSIYGSSGINMNSGAASTTISAGAVSIVGSAASTLSTSAGALTITAAASSTWGIGTASSGVGGTLTLKGGNAGADGNNDGGDLVLQGGQKNGTGLGGSVIVRPLVDTTDAFQVQNSASTPLLTADSSNMVISVTGTDSAFAKLTIANGHVSSTQTTAPTMSTPTNCGTTPSATVTPGSTDSAGSFTVTAGSGAVAGPCVVTLSFHSAYSSAPKSVMIVPTTAVGASPQGKAGIVSAALTTSFSTTITPANPAAGEVNSYYYWVIE